MKKYRVYKTVSYDQDIVIEAKSSEEAQQLAEYFSSELDWNSPIDYNYTYVAYDVEVPVE